MTISLPITFDRKSRLGLFEMVFQDFKFHNFLGEHAPRPP